MREFGRGVRLGVDVGQVRVGVAACDPDTILATPVETLTRDRSVSYVAGGKVPPVLPTDIEDLREIAEERLAVAVYVGLPKHLSGARGVSAEMAVNYASLVQRVLPHLEVRLVDERLTSKTAHSALHDAGRRAREHRTVIDQAAAVVILDTALEAEKRIGSWAGESVE